MTLARRSFITGLIGILAAPAIVRVESLMKVVAPKPSMFWSLESYPGPNPALNIFALMEETKRRIHAAMYADVMNGTITEMQTLRSRHEVRPGLFLDLPPINPPTFKLNYERENPPRIEYAPLRRT